MKRILLTLAALMITAPMVLSAQTRGTLRGQVMDSDGQGIPGATVIVDGTSRGDAADVDGNYTIGGLDARTYTITAKSVGFEPQSIEGVVVSPNSTTVLNFTLSTTGDEGGDTLVVYGDRKNPVDANRPGTEQVITGEELLNSSVQSLTGNINRVASVSAGGGIRGARNTEGKNLRDGIDVGDPISGTALGGAPDVSILAVEQVVVQASGFEAEFGDVLSGVINTITRSGRNNRFEAVFAYSTGLPFLYGSSSPITVKKVQSDVDTVLPGYKLGGSGTATYEFGVGGYVPGLKNSTGNNALTFFLTGIYTGSDKTGGYEVYDMSQEFADARRDIADELWGYHLEPTNLADRDEQYMSRNLNLKMRYDLTGMSNIEFGGEIGLLSRENHGWSDYYMLDNPVFTTVENGNVEYDTLTSVLEREAQSVDQNTIVNRLSGKYFQGLGDGTSFFEVTAGYVSTTTELGKKDETRDYGIFEVYDIPDIADAYDLGTFNADDPTFVESPNRAIDIYEIPRNREDKFVRNPLTGLFEGGQAPGASRNPYGQSFLFGNAWQFPAHGNSRTMEIRDSRTFSFKGAYETNFKLGSNPDDPIFANARAGAEFTQYTIRRHNNSLPWNNLPFFDVYGYENIYLEGGDSATEALLEFTSEPFNPYKGAVWAQTRFSYNTIVFSPGLRFDFFNPNTLNAPASRQTREEVAAGLDTAGQASMKFQVSPRIGISYPVSPDANFRVNFAMMFKMPEFSTLFDNAYGEAQRGNQLFGNPDMEPQKVIVYDLGYEARIADFLFVDISAFYRDIFNQTGVTFIPAVPSPYILNTVQEYGNVRGLEVTLQRRRSADNFYGSLSYTLQRAVGTASSPSANYRTLIGSPDPYTGESRPTSLTEFPLSYDRTHKFNTTLGVFWSDDDGPTLGGIHLLENTDIAMTFLWNSGAPYTQLDAQERQVGEYNANRFPSQFDTELRIARTIPLGDLLGDFAGRTRIEIYGIVRNIFNWTSPIGFYTTTGSPDNNGTTLNRPIGEFSAFDYYAEEDPNRPETFSSFQVDPFGVRYYNPYVDANLDGVVTQSEKYAGYQRLVSTIQSFRGNYDQPRSVTVGARLYF